MNGVAGWAVGAALVVGALALDAVAIRYALRAWRELVDEWRHAGWRK